MFEVLILNDAIRALIANNESAMKIREEALKNGYTPLVIDGINKVIEGISNLEEINNKLAIY